MENRMTPPLGVYNEHWYPVIEPTRVALVCIQVATVATYKHDLL